MEKYAETIEELKGRRFDVYSLDWLGQGLSTRLLPNRHKGHARSYQDYIDDLVFFVERIVRPAAPATLSILAHSMGGHIALRYLHDHPGRVDRAVLLSPMAGIVTGKLPLSLVRLLAGFTRRAGLEHLYPFGYGDYRFDALKFEGNRLTSDPVRFWDEAKAIAHNPDLALGGLTFGWLAATLESIDILNGPGYAGEIKTPVLILSAGSDRVVSIEAQKSLCAAMPRCRFVFLRQARHEILKETDALRSAFWREFDRFTADMA
jgi:lysophospholipase